VIKSGLLIAIVDDEECVRTALCRLLRSAGIDAEAFPSGDEFLESLRTHRPDCVLLDVCMPRMSGFDVQTRLEESAARVPVIIITGQDSPAAHDQALAGGAVDYLCKPIKKETLLDAIHRAVEEENSSETLEERPEQFKSPGSSLGKYDQANQQ
jgi:FixJ family two-component response regulator